MATKTAVEYRNYIGGEWTGAQGGTTLEVRNPANGDLVCSAQQSSVQDARDAIAAAKHAFEHSDWPWDPDRRTKALQKLAQTVRENSERLTRLLQEESGKLLPVARAEVERSAESFNYYGGMARNIFGRTVNLDPDSFAMLMREPVGVVAVIAPWNMPLSLMVRSLAPALAAGNTVVMKPASITPAACAELVQMIDQMEEFPKGVVNFVTGPGPVVGAELCTHPDVEMIAFTGDTSTGKEIMRMAAGTLKKLSLELGGKSPNIIFADADFERAVRGAINGASWFHAGQVCVAGTRLLVEESVHERYVEALKSRAEKMTVGDPTRGRVDVGPIVSEGQLSRILDYVAEGKEQGRLVCGGTRLTDGDLAKGHYIAPTIFDGVPNESRLAQEEISGPVLPIHPFKDEEEACAIANASDYGLAAAVWSRDINKALRTARRVRAGQVWINTFGKLYPNTEMGGFKQSGVGRSYGIDGLLEFTEMKNINIQLER